MLHALVEPKVRQWVESQGMELGPFHPSQMRGSYKDWLDDQKFEDMKTDIMRLAASEDDTPVKILKGLNRAGGGEWSPGQQQQAEEFRNAFAQVAPYFMRWSPKWWDTLHGSTGSSASLASAIADAHKYDDDMTAEKAVQMADSIVGEIYKDPMKHRGFSAAEIGDLYRQGARRGLWHMDMDADKMLEEMTPVIGVASALRDVMPEGYNRNDMGGIFNAFDVVSPGMGGYESYGDLEKRIRTSKQIQRMGGPMGAVVQRMGGIKPGPGMPSLHELNAQHAQLSRQAAGSPVMEMMAATRRMGRSGLLKPDSAAEKYLEALEGGQVEDMQPHQWAEMMESSGIPRHMALTMLNQRAENLQHVDEDMIMALRGAQRGIDHEPQLAAMQRMYPPTSQLNRELLKGEQTRLANQWGYKSWDHYNALQGDRVKMLPQIRRQAQQKAELERMHAGYNQSNPISRTIDNLKFHPNPSGRTMGASFLGGLPKIARDATVAVDLDGTLAKQMKPYDNNKIGDPRPGAKDAMDELKEKNCTIIINTVRGNKKLVGDWLKEHEIPYDHINENPDQPPGASAKPLADVYIDDRAVDARPAWRKVMEKVRPRIKVAAIRGIPDRTDFGDTGKLTKDQLVDLFIQRHLAQRAGEHFDYRIGTPDTGLYSWSMKPTRLPEPGQKRFVRQQPVHSHPYGSFEGRIGSGYGAGTVKQEQKGKVLITKASPTKIEFTTATSGVPERFILLKPDKWGEREWLLINNTPKEVIPYEKVRYKKIPAESVEPLITQMQEGTSVQAKIDGASSLIKLMSNGAEVVSYRVSKKTGRPIVHTERFFGGRPQMDIPKELVGTVLKGELYGERQPTQNPTAKPGRTVAEGTGSGPAVPGTGRLDDGRGSGRVIPPQELGGLLNASLVNSLDRQRQEGIQLKNMLFDIQQLGKQPVGQDVPYAERRKMIEQVLAHLPADKFGVPEQATTPEDAQAMWSQIRDKQHPLTEEGVVIHPPTGKPMKAKNLEESDVYIRSIYPGAGKYHNLGAGGFAYALSPGGPEVGRVGTGLSDDLRRDMHANPDAYTDRVARIHSQEQLPSGAWRSPALIALHEDY